MSFRKLFSLPLIVGMFIGIATTSAAGVLGSTFFQDVTPGSLGDEAIGAMVDIGLFTDENARFRPDDPISRREMAIVMERFYGIMNGDIPAMRVSLQNRSSSSRSSASRRSSSSSSRSSSSSSSSVETIPGAGEFTFTTNEFNIQENIKSISLAVVRRDGSQGDVSVEFKTADGTAVKDEDYYEKSGTLSFKDGETTKTFTILLIDDEVSEDSETVTISLSNPKGGAILGEIPVTTLRIGDNEQGNTSASGGNSSQEATNSAAGSFMFSAKSYMAAEDGDTVTITVERKNGSQGTAAINYKTANDSAKVGSEYSSTNGTLTFGAGEMKKTFTVQVYDNNDVNGNKVFKVNLESPTGGAGIINSQADVVIRDDEASSYDSGDIRFEFSDYTVSESDGEAEITVMRVGGAKGTVSVDYDTNSNTAQGNDFTKVSGKLIFADGEGTKAFYVPIKDDSESDSGETVTLTITNASGATIISPSFATLTIE